MIIAGIYSFNDGVDVVRLKYPTLLEEIEKSILSINSSLCKTEISKKQIFQSPVFYSPVKIHEHLKTALYPIGWQTIRVACDYANQYYVKDYKAKNVVPGASREMGFVKQKLGVDLQFEDYDGQVSGAAAKMTIFRNLGFIDTGIEIVPVKAFADEMSSGVSYFEQFVWDLEKRGVADIDVPVMIIGIDA